MRSETGRRHRLFGHSPGACTRLSFAFLQHRSGPLQFLFSPRETPLLAAAIALGDWLRLQPETTRQQRKIIEQMQQALRTLPAVPNLAAEFGFHFYLNNGEGLVYRAWRVSLSRSGLEIYSVYTPDQPIELREKMSNELYFWIKPGEASGHDGHYLHRWIAEVVDPARLREGTLEFQPYAAYFD